LFLLEKMFTKLGHPEKAKQCSIPLSYAKRREYDTLWNQIHLRANKESS